MPHPLVKRLRRLDSRVLTHQPPASREEVRELEEAIEHKLPEDYRACLLELGPFELRGPNIRMSLHTVMDVLTSLGDEVISERMPGITVIGADAGEFAYYYDVSNHNGRGPFALFLVGYGTLSFNGSYFVAPTLTQAVDELLAGEDFRERDPLG